VEKEFYPSVQAQGPRKGERGSKGSSVQHGQSIDLEV